MPELNKKLRKISWGRSLSFLEDKDGIMANQPGKRKAPPPRYLDELRERAVKMVRELRAADPNDRGVLSRVARQLGVHFKVPISLIGGGVIQVHGGRGQTNKCDIRRELSTCLNSGEWSSLMSSNSRNVVLTLCWKLLLGLENPAMPS
jgi:hypothetical protein